MGQQLRRRERDGVVEDRIGALGLDAGVVGGVGDGPRRDDVAAAGARVDLPLGDVGLAHAVGFGFADDAKIIVMAIGRRAHGGAEEHRRAVAARP